MLDIAADKTLEFLWLELTNRCNLECSHCYAGSGPGEPQAALSARDFEQVIAEAHDLGCRQVQFIGGEATLSPDLPQLLRHAHATGYTFIELFSNLTRLPLGLAELLVETQAHVATSVYADTAEIHDAVTTRPGSWARTVANIRALVALDIPVRAGIILSDVNRHRAEPTVGFLKSLGVRNVGFDDVRSVGRADHAGGCGGDGGCDGQISQLCGGCADNVVCVSPDGLVSPCIMSKFLPLGHILDGGLAAAATAQTTAEIRDRIRATCPDAAPSWPVKDAIVNECFPCPPNCTPRCYPNRNWHRP